MIGVMEDSLRTAAYLLSVQVTCVLGADDRVYVIVGVSGGDLKRRHAVQCFA